MTGQLQLSTPPTARAARRRIRARTAAVPLGRRLGELYERLLYVAVVGGLAVQAVAGGLDPGRSLSSDAPAVALTHWLVVVGTLALLAATSGAILGFGPLVVGPATQTWLLNSPIRACPADLEGWVR